MKFLETALKGAFIIEPEVVRDERGHFARTWCRSEFAAHGLNPGLAQCSISFNPLKGTLRGMHYQVPPHQEAKLVRCSRGSIYDVIIDLRSASPSYGRWLAAELSASNGKMLYVPEGFAHGFQTLESDAEVSYQISECYEPASSRGVRWNDPAFDISWPYAPTCISERDRSYPDSGKTP